MLRGSFAFAAVATVGLGSHAFADQALLLKGHGHLTIDDPSTRAYQIEYEWDWADTAFIVNFADGGDAPGFAAGISTIVNVTGADFSNDVRYSNSGGHFSSGSARFLSAEGGFGHVHVSGGTFEGIEVSGGSRLRVSGSPEVQRPYYAEGQGTLEIVGGYHDAGIKVVEKAVARIRGGNIDTSAAPVEVAGGGRVIFYGSDFLLDGAAVGFDDFVVNEGDALTVAGVLEDGSLLNINFLGGEAGGGFIEFRSGSTVIPTPAAAGLGLAMLALGLTRRRRD